MDATPGTTEPAAPSTVAPDHPGINELFSLLAYGEVAAFYRLTEEARMAPDLRGRINMARMAAAEMAHYELLRSTLEGRGVDVLPAPTHWSPTQDGITRARQPVGHAGVEPSARVPARRQPDGVMSSDPADGSRTPPA